MDRSIIITGTVLIAAMFGCEPSEAATVTEVAAAAWEESPWLTAGAIFVAYTVTCAVIESIFKG